MVCTILALKTVQKLSVDGCGHHTFIECHIGDNVKAQISQLSKHVFALKPQFYVYCQIASVTIDCLVFKDLIASEW